MEGYYEGNLKLTSSVHTTGLPIPRLLAMGKEMGLALPCASTMRTQLAQVIMPAVDIVYLRRMSEVEAIVRAANTNRSIDLAMDGRYDSPGYCASNCTVSFIDVLTNYILSVVNMAKNMRGIDGASGRMEKEGVRRGLEALLAKRFMVSKRFTTSLGSNSQCLLISDHILLR
ncbi:hypothetical protein PENTCL1PPCAC_24141 [Pristionchus entomophagus]|uniref:Uncharacterized protein n=1 Tax=Pristionchus entomophagus TaxID=358040 RepID=A0AAV5SLW2_9BILA|nr:hypothetical protein PENTCL1PPCAC_1385 [Pristionchus entomophagus]GMS84078.1 hypothetical protein PENTCL1PPCAC_6253 [Pristionchus entomophagus]GMS88579.1 hypothetical protein PENTCL1PPCAC_10755 [Pristionchus entomophagus]GMS91919.1 hypothetical protein PENTCL1PPCAC_14095 [Pristionchus entomophagus]GMT01967.1 hypothetical protein PENTCL1PPCAC_24141 [Pristionchus entomophagus]